MMSNSYAYYMSNDLNCKEITVTFHCSPTCNRNKTATQAMFSCPKLSRGNNMKKLTTYIYLAKQIKTK